MSITFFLRNIRKVLLVTIAFLARDGFSLDQDFVGSFILQSSPYRIEISGKQAAYTMRSVVFEKTRLGVNTGFYGTIFCPAPGKFIGAGHSEGGKEEVKRLTLKVDGQVIPPEAGRTFSGQSVTFQKISRLADLELTELTELSPEKIVITRSYCALRNQPAYSLYVFQFCWSSETKEWLAELADGQIIEGAFRDDDGWRLNEDVRWTAVYLPAEQTGILTYYPQVIPGQQRKSCYWDKKNIYHKYYLMMKVPPLLSQGAVLGPFTAILKGFTASPDTWKKEGLHLAESLKLASGLPTKVKSEQVQKQ
ncbi:MAG: hypothetical protein NC911_04645 [Candidatus Omnitrophica bacterium]|nr:hypothetical protein [Candidatus Omnitrophota bacterium]